MSRSTSPLFRQLRTNDHLGMGEAARSKASEALEPRTRTADRVAKSICPVWEELELDRAMDMIADRLIAARDDPKYVVAPQRARMAARR
jgi:hypothetical protein